MHDIPATLPKILSGKTRPGQITGSQGDEAHAQTTSSEMRMLILSSIEQTQASELIVLRQKSKHGRHRQLNFAVNKSRHGVTKEILWIASSL